MQQASDALVIDFVTTISHACSGDCDDNVVADILFEELEESGNNLVEATSAGDSTFISVLLENAVEIEDLGDMVAELDIDAIVVEQFVAAVKEEVEHFVTVELVEVTAAPSPESTPAPTDSEPPADNDTENDCSDFMCDLYCGEHGYEVDENGCEMCSCVEHVDDIDDYDDVDGVDEDESNADDDEEDGTEDADCPDVMCEMYCKHGFEVDENGCEICSCNSTATDTDDSSYDDDLSREAIDDDEVPNDVVYVVSETLTVLVPGSVDISAFAPPSLTFSDTLVSSFVSLMEKTLTEIFSPEIGFEIIVTHLNGLAVKRSSRRELQEIMGENGGSEEDEEQGAEESSKTAQTLSVKFALVVTHECTGECIENEVVGVLKESTADDFKRMENSVESGLFLEVLRGFVDEEYELQYDEAFEIVDMSTVEVSSYTGPNDNDFKAAVQSARSTQLMSDGSIVENDFGLLSGGRRLMVNSFAVGFVVWVAVSLF